MARKVETGIVITASAKGLKKGVKAAGKSLKGLRKGLKLSGEGVEKFGASYKSGIDVVFKSVEVFKSIQGLLTDAVGRFLEASAKFRSAGDSQIRAIAGFKREADRTLGAFGDIFTAIAAGLADSLGPMLKSLREFIKTNRELIGTKIIEFLAETSRFFLKVLAPAVLYTHKIFIGFKGIVNLLKSSMAGLNSTIADVALSFDNLGAKVAAEDMAEATEKAAGLAREVMKYGGLTKAPRALREEWKKAREEQDRLSASYKRTVFQRDISQAAATRAAQESSKAAAEAAREILAAERASAELAKTIEEVNAAIESGIDGAVAAVIKRLQEQKDANVQTNEEIAASEAAAEARRSAAAKRAVELAARAADEKRRRLEEEKALLMQIGGIMGTGIGSAIKDVIQGTKSASDAMKDFAIQIGQAIVKATVLAAIQTAVRAGTMGAGTGGLLSGLTGSLLSFNSGGYVPGFASGGGVDSVNARLTPGEYVLPKGLVDSIRLGKAPAKASYANGGLVAAGASNGPSAINVQMQTFAVPSRGEFRRWYKSSVSPNVRSMGKRGQL